MDGINQDRVWCKSGTVGRLEGEWWKWCGQRRKRVLRHLTLLWGLEKICDKLRR